MSYGYEMCLKKAGAIVHCFEYFGSYQGDWYAKVTYNGETGWITGCYGSCSGCDAFQSEFGYFDDATDKQYADFGRTYLETLLTQEKQEEILARQAADKYWGSDYEDALKFVKENA